MRIIAKRSDGGVSIMRFVANSPEGKAVVDAPEHMDVIVGAEIAAWEQTADGVTIVSWRVVDDAEIPTDRTFMNAWVDDGVTLKHDMVKAREIWRNKMRGARARLLTALDVASTRATEAAQPLDAIIAQKQTLRDVTAVPEIEAAQTVDELKSVWPDCLKGIV